MRQRIRHAWQWFGDLKHNGIKMRQYHDWHRKMFYISFAATAIVCGAFAYFYDEIAYKLLFVAQFPSPSRTTWWHMPFYWLGISNPKVIVGAIGLTLCLPWLYMFFRNSWHIPFKFRCPHCDKVVTSATPWKCAHCNTEHTTDDAFEITGATKSFLGRCKNRECKKRPWGMCCPHCSELILLEARPRLPPAHRRDAGPATPLPGETVPLLQNDSVLELFFWVGVTMILGATFYLLALKPDPPKSGYLWLGGGVAVLLLVVYGKSVIREKQGPPAPKPVVNKEHVGPYARKAFDWRFSFVQGTYVAAWTGWFGILVGLALGVYRVVYSQDVTFQRHVESVGDILGLWALMGIVCAPVAVVSQWFYTKHPLRFLCPHCRGYMPSR